MRQVVSLQRAGKYQRPAWRPLQEQKVLDERALMASQWPSSPGNALGAGREDARRLLRLPLLRLSTTLPAHTPAGWGHGGTRYSRTSLDEWRLFGQSSGCPVHVV